MGSLLWYDMRSSIWYGMIWDPNYDMASYGILIMVSYDMGSSIWFGMILDPDYGMIWDPS